MPTDAPEADPLAELTQAQSDAVALYVDCGNITEVCAKLGIGRSSWHRWHRTTPAFRAAILAAREQLNAAVYDEARAAVMRATARLLEIVNGENEGRAILAARELHAIYARVDSALADLGELEYQRSLAAEPTPPDPG